MNLETDLLVSRFSYILGTISVVGFLIVARNEVRLWLQTLFVKVRAAERVRARKQNSARTTSLPGLMQQPVDTSAIIPGLIFLGGIVSTSLLIVHSKVELLELSINFDVFLLIAAAFTLLPGGLIGMAAGAWINATQHIPRVEPLIELVIGMLVYLVIIGLFELTEVHLLLLVCGPAITLLVYWFSPAAS